MVLPTLQGLLHIVLVGLDHLATLLQLAKPFSGLRRDGRPLPVPRHQRKAPRERPGGILEQERTSRAGSRAQPLIFLVAQPQHEA